MVTLRSEAGVHVLDLGDDENRFGPTWLADVDAALDTVAAAPAPLVTTGGGRFYSNGLDLEWLGEHPDEMGSYVTRVQALFSRVLALGVPTIAAINGHAFGAGAMLAMAHDWRVMRADRGYLCFPEVDIHIPFTPGMAALVQAKVTPRTAVDAMTTGHRFGAPEAVAAGLVDDEASAENLVTEAIARVAPLIGKDAGTLAKIKATMYAAPLVLLGGSDADGAA